MGKHILVPFDGSPQSELALRYSLREWPDADIVVLTVVDLSELNLHFQRKVIGFGKDWYENAEAYAEELLDGARELADEFERQISTKVEFGAPHNAIVKYAMDHDIDQIVIGSHGRTGTTRILLGSVTEAVLRRTSVPVLVVR